MRSILFVNRIIFATGNLVARLEPHDGLLFHPPTPSKEREAGRAERHTEEGQGRGRRRAGRKRGDPQQGVERGSVRRRVARGWSLTRAGRAAIGGVRAGRSRAA
jgi:hypothetical protein